MSNKKKRAKLKALREEKRNKTTSYRGLDYRVYSEFWPGFDYVKWNRARRVAKASDVVENSVTVDMEDVIVDWTSMDIKPVCEVPDKNREKMKKIGKLLSKVGI